MALWDKKTIWVLLALVGATGAEFPSVNHPFTETCAVKGSTVTLPCTFTPRTSFISGGKQIPLRIVRVGWCVNHPVCQDMKRFPVYDSNSTRTNPRYRYLGDLKGICTLQIRDVQMEDNQTFRFRMEADDAAGHLTSRAGVNITVVDGVRMSVSSSSGDGQVRGGGTVSLQCSSSRCSTHQLTISWFRDDVVLSESGPALQLGPLTAAHSGSYSCGLGPDRRTRSEPWRLQVEAAEEDQPVNLLLVVGAASGALLVVIALLLIAFMVKRKRAAGVRPGGGETGQKDTDNVYSNVPPAAKDEGRREAETGPETEDVSYAPVQFRKTTQRRPVEEAEDATVYSTVAREAEAAPVEYI